MFRTPLLLASIVALSGCAATGHLYSDHLKAQSPIPSGLSRVTIYRTGETDQYSARDARISLDGKTVSKVAYKGFTTFEIQPGSHAVFADMWDAVGSCKVQFEAISGNEYYFEVAPRREHLMGSLVFGFVGAAIESAGKECGGAFAIVSKPRDTATIALSSLKLSE
ncbi:hypothetical protein JY96_21730 [Aquabacterium sp. NJ1]|nr:hypothetical protein JY96_21730 [Aquabacterium sp. NJ1]